MAGRHERRVAVDSGETDAAAWSVFLQHRGVFGRSGEPDCDRWICGLRRATGAEVAALCLLDASRGIITSLSTSDGHAGGGQELAASGTLQAHLLGLVASPVPAAPPPYYEASVTVGGLVVGQVAIVGQVA